MKRYIKELDVFVHYDIEFCYHNGKKIKTVDTQVLKLYMAKANVSHIKRANGDMPFFPSEILDLAKVIASINKEIFHIEEDDLPF